MVNCSTCNYYVRPNKDKTARGLCSLWDVRGTAPYVMPTFGCGRHERRVAPVDRQYTAYLLEQLADDLVAAKKMIKKSERKVAKLTKRLVNNGGDDA